MPRVQSLLPLLRPLAAPPRRAACEQLFRFSTATTLRAERSSATTTAAASPVKKTPKAPQRSPEAPPNPKEAARAADLAAAEAATDADNANAPSPKPILPSERPTSSSPNNAQAADHVKPSSPPADASDATTDLKAVQAKSWETTKKNTKSKPVDDVHPPVGDALDAATTLKAVKPDTFKAPAKARISSRANPNAAQKTTLELPPPKYHVARSSTRNLPIYTDYKRGGNLHLTTIRKITGDLSALRDELRVFLNKKNEEVKINSLTQHVIVKGHHVSQITEFLKARGM